MCGSLELEGISKKKGSLIPYFNWNLRQEGKAIWTGFFQEEKMQWWKTKTPLELVAIQVEGFTEGIHTFRIPPAYKIMGAIGSKDVLISGQLIYRKETLRIITRPALTSFEEVNHKRWPIARFTNKEPFDGPPLSYRWEYVI